MQRRMLLSLVAAGAAAVFALGGIVSAGPPEDKTVMLEITGMT